jgi:hypothetical protein
LKNIEWLIGLTLDEVRHWCDNKGSVKANILTAIPTPTDMLVLAIMAIKEKITANIKCRYVTGHQDEKKRKVKSSKQRRKEKQEMRLERLKRIQEVEIKGGAHAPPYQKRLQRKNTTMQVTHPWKASGNSELKSTYQTKSDLMWCATACRRSSQAVHCPPTLQPPYSGSKAMLHIGDIWITSDYDKNIHFASSIPCLRGYCMCRHKWNTFTMDLIHWDAIEGNRKNVDWAGQCRTMRVMHGWLPIMHNLGKYMPA